MGGFALFAGCLGPNRLARKCLSKISFSRTRSANRGILRPDPLPGLSSQRTSDAPRTDDDSLQNKHGLR